MYSDEDIERTQKKFVAFEQAAFEFLLNSLKKKAARIAEIEDMDWSISAFERGLWR